MPPAHGLERTPSRLQSEHLLPWHRGRPIPRDFPPALPLPAPVFAPGVDLLQVVLAWGTGGSGGKAGLGELPPSPQPRHFSLVTWADARDSGPGKARARPSLGVLSSPTPHLRACSVSAVGAAEPVIVRVSELMGIPRPTQGGAGPQVTEPGTWDCPCFPHSRLPLSFLHLLLCCLLQGREASQGRAIKNVWHPLARC